MIIILGIFTNINSLYLIFISNKILKNVFIIFSRYLITVDSINNLLYFIILLHLKGGRGTMMEKLKLFNCYKILHIFPIIRYDDWAIK